MSCYINEIVNSHKNYFTIHMLAMSNNFYSTRCTVLEMLETSPYFYIFFLDKNS